MIQARPLAEGLPELPGMAARRENIPPNQWTVELISDAPETMVFPDHIVSMAPVTPQFGADGVAKLPIDLPLPNTLEPGRELYARVRRGAMTVALQRIALPPGVAVRLSDAPRGLRAGQRFRLTAALRNESGRVIEDATAALELPSGLELVEARNGPRTKLGKLGRDETRRLAWQVRATSPLEAWQINLALSTGNGGGAVATIPVAITGPNQTPVQRQSMKRKR